MPRVEGKHTGSHLDPVRHRRQALEADRDRLDVGDELANDPAGPARGRRWQGSQAARHTAGGSSSELHRCGPGAEALAGREGGIGATKQSHAPRVQLINVQVDGREFKRATPSDDEGAVEPRGVVRRNSRRGSPTPDDQARRRADQERPQRRSSSWLWRSVFHLPVALAAGNPGHERGQCRRRSPWAPWSPA